MEPYYLHQVEQSLVHAYSTLRAEGEFSLDTVSALEEDNISIVIADRDSLEILYNSQMSDRFLSNLTDRVLPFVLDNASSTDTGYTINTDELYQQTTSGTTVSDGRRVTLGGVTDLYVLDISTSYASISQATTLSLQFSLLVGLLVMIMAVVAFSRMSSMLIHPITQITNVAHQIAHLNFSEKCDVSSDDEIGNMAESINTMSDFMQAHISQLEAANEQLHKDIALQKAQDEARKNLVSNLSHDLKTPIGLISGYADGLRSGMAKTESEVREYCDIICDEADRMNTLILHMMELFRLESGTVELTVEEFDLSDLLNYLVEIFAIEIERAGIQFTRDYGDCLYICSDYFSVEQVLTNYMQNAVSHMSQGHTLRLQVEDRGSCYRVSIFNSAAPIPQQELEKIWDSFYRLDKSRSRDRRESGLGLSIVRSNMELLGGAYGVENVPDGVIFWAEFQKSES
jgi:signal transduction histidine kinase